MLIHGSDTCNNSPKNQFVEDFTIALLQKQNMFIKEKSSEDFQLEVIGSKLNLETLPTDLTELTIFSSISHGKFGACQGKLTSSGPNYAFSIHYQFLTTTKKIMKTAQLFLIQV